jgi:hypothetical protein
MASLKVYMCIMQHGVHEMDSGDQEDAPESKKGLSNSIKKIYS